MIGFNRFLTKQGLKDESSQKQLERTLEVKKAQKVEVQLHITSVFAKSVYCVFMSWEKGASLKRALSSVPLIG